MANPNKQEVLICLDHFSPAALVAAQIATNNFKHIATASNAFTPMISLHPSRRNGAIGSLSAVYGIRPTSFTKRSKLKSKKTLNASSRSFPISNPNNQGGFQTIAKTKKGLEGTSQKNGVQIVRK